jgi:hypothetical protein
MGRSEQEVANSVGVANKTSALQLCDKPTRSGEPERRPCTADTIRSGAFYAARIEPTCRDHRPDPRGSRHSAESQLA